MVKSTVEAESFAVTFGKRFSEALRDRSLSQHTAASILGRPQGRLSEYANGKRVPPIETLNEMIAGLDLDPRILVPEWFSKVRLLEAIEARKALRESSERSEAVRERLELKPIHLIKEGPERDKAMKEGIKSGRLKPR